MAGRGFCSRAEKPEAREMPVNAAESHASGSGFVSSLFKTRMELLAMFSCNSLTIAHQILGASGIPRYKIAILKCLKKQ